LISVSALRDADRKWQLVYLSSAKARRLTLASLRASDVSDCAGLEVQTQRELNLPVRTQSNCFRNRAVDDAECSAACCRIWLPRLQLIGTSAQHVRQRGWRVGEVGRVEEVEDLCAELEVGRFSDCKLLAYDHVLLDEAWPVQQVTLQVAVRARF